MRSRKKTPDLMPTPKPPGHALLKPPEKPSLAEQNRHLIATSSAGVVGASLKADPGRKSPEAPELRQPFAAKRQRDDLRRHPLAAKVAPPLDRRVLNRALFECTDTGFFQWWVLTFGESGTSGWAPFGNVFMLPATTADESPPKTARAGEFAAGAVIEQLTSALQAIRALAPRERGTSEASNLAFDMGAIARKTLGSLEMAMRNAEAIKPGAAP